MALVPWEQAWAACQACLEDLRTKRIAPYVSPNLLFRNLNRLTPWTATPTPPTTRPGRCPTRRKRREDRGRGRSRQRARRRDHAVPRRSRTPPAAPAGPAAAPPPPSTRLPARCWPPPAMSSPSSPTPAAPPPATCPCTRSARTPGCSTRNASCSPTQSAMAAYNAESTLARMLRPHYSPGRRRSPRPAPGGVHPLRRPAHHRGHPARPARPATAPRRSRALHALCQQLTETGTRYPDTNLTISYSVKGQPDAP